MSIATYSSYVITVSDIENYTIVYACHLCDASEFSNARNLRDHYEAFEANKYLSASAARKRQNAAKNYGCPSCSNHHDTANKLENHLDEKHIMSARPDVTVSFKKLKNENKWTLSTGTVVESRLYDFDRLQSGEHPSQSFNFEVNDSELLYKTWSIHEWI